MTGRDEIIYAELAELWRRVCSDPPPEPGVDISHMLDILMTEVEPKTYDRFYSPHLRESQISSPKIDQHDGLAGQRQAAVEERLREMLRTCPVSAELKALIARLD
ncbi:MAG: hypothetical protein Q8M88_16785 [Phenylobacterium sp.]|uniref:hypothetical protein n=1 Tax=Phenylobacterium sp. TaxID=1871053 RepID=UPI002736DEFC|nr:hypothetical protein [Phenylobacterium sp.]MDP3176087.1 hypothetical protein [Phenylobacterium sp.]